jgi:hypothetical protein
MIAVAKDNVPSVVDPESEARRAKNGYSFGARVSSVAGSIDAERRASLGRITGPCRQVTIQPKVPTEAITSD